MGIGIWKYYDFWKMVKENQIEISPGQVFIFGKSAGFIPLEWLVTFQKRLEKSQLDNLIYLSAKEMGVRFFKNIYDLHKISWEEVLQLGINSLSQGGWGETKTPEINLAQKFYKIALTNGAEGKNFGNVGHAVDHFVRGCYASGAHVLFGGECDSVETKCIAAGDDYCEFIAQPTEKFDKKDPMVKRQLHVPKI